MTIVYIGYISSYSIIISTLRMNLLSFLKNPIFSLQKLGRAIHKTSFLKNYSQEIESVRQQKTASVDLDKLFEDKRHLVNRDIEKIRSISLKILSMIDYLSLKYDFEYFMSYGTLIGVIRHEGFIPWDDDIDIMMTKQDLEKLISVCYQLPESIKFFPQGLNFLKVMDKHSKISIDGKRGVAVDIFVLNEFGDKYDFINVHSQRKIVLKKSEVFPLVKMSFENIQAPVPANYHELLTKIYGDYMQLPPENQRVSHHVNSTSVHIYPFPKSKV